MCDVYTSTANTSPSSKYFTVSARFILILWYAYMYVCWVMERRNQRCYLPSFPYFQVFWDAKKFSINLLSNKTSFSLKKLNLKLHYKPSVRITAKLLIQLMLCVLILYMSGGTYSLMSTPNDKHWYPHKINSHNMCDVRS